MLAVRSSMLLIIAALALAALPLSIQQVPAPSREGSTNVCGMAANDSVPATIYASLVATANTHLLCASAWAPAGTAFAGCSTGPGLWLLAQGTWVLM